MRTFRVNGEVATSVGTSNWWFSPSMRRLQVDGPFEVRRKAHTLKYFTNGLVLNEAVFTKEPLSKLDIRERS